MEWDWNARFADPGYVYGTEPTAFLAAHAGLIPPGARTLSVAEGEGRNATWLALQGCQVTAFDGSRNALAKAERLAEQAGVHLDLHQADIADWAWQAQSYELVVACFFQFAPPALRARIFAGLKTALAPGGRLMLTGYSTDQLEFGTGGPPVAEMLYTKDLLREAFGDLRILRLESYEKTLSEGPGHSGKSALIDLIAEKP